VFADKSGYPASMKPIGLLSLCLLFVCSGSVQGREFNTKYNAWISTVLGQHFTGQLNELGLYPMVEFRTGYQVGRYFTTRLELGLAITKITNPDRDSFAGAGLMGSHLSLGFLFTPALTDNFSLNLGGGVGVWLTSIWGDDLLDTTYGSVKNYLEGFSVNLAAIIGFEFDLNLRWALLTEVRYNRAMVNFAGKEYNAGGFGVFFGFIYRLPAPGLL